MLIPMVIVVLLFFQLYSRRRLSISVHTKLEQTNEPEANSNEIHKTNSFYFIPMQSEIVIIIRIRRATYIYWIFDWDKE